MGAVIPSKQIDILDIVLLGDICIADADSPEDGVFHEGRRAL